LFIALNAKGAGYLLSRTSVWNIKEQRQANELKKQTTSSFRHCPCWFYGLGFSGFEL